ncbi:MAG: M1 family metallopeptidase [Chloroflexi bacterium]|nr:M1 family metallopeptidase [Chloroflexota bacterium]
MRQAQFLLAVLITFVLSQTAAAQGPQTSPDPIFPTIGNPGYDAQHYTIDLTVEVANNRIAGVVTIEALLTDDLEIISLDFRGFDVTEVTLNGVTVDFERQPNKLIVIPPEAPLHAGEQVTLAVAYSGVPGQNLTPEEAALGVGWHDYTGGVHVDSEPTGAAGWYPVNDHPADKATYTLRITVPEIYTVAANGILENVNIEGGWATYLWETRSPVASYLVTVNIAELLRIEHEGPDGVLLRHYLPPSLAADPPDQLDLIPDMIAYFSDVFGPYPFAVYGIAVAEDRLFGLEAQTLTVLSAQLFRAPITERAVPSPLAVEAVLAHELAHHWFGNSVSLSAWDQVWLKEGFATYASWLWLTHNHESVTLDQIVRASYQFVASGGSYVSGETPFDELTGPQFMQLISRLDIENLPISEVLARITNPDVLLPALDSLSDRTHELPEEPIMVSKSELRERLSGVEPGSVTGADALDVMDSLPVTEMTGRGLLEVLATLAAYDRRGEQAFNLLTPPGSPTQARLLNPGVYQRGALTLHALRLEVGDRTFFDILRTYAARYAHGNATTADFVYVAEEISGRDLNNFFDTWLYKDMLPSIDEMDLAVDTE